MITVREKRGAMAYSTFCQSVRQWFEVIAGLMKIFHMKAFYCSSKTNETRTSIRCIIFSPFKTLPTIAPALNVSHCHSSALDVLLFLISRVQAQASLRHRTHSALSLTLVRPNKFRHPLLTPPVSVRTVKYTFTTAPPPRNQNDGQKRLLQQNISCPSSG